MMPEYDPFETPDPATVLNEEMAVLLAIAEGAEENLTEALRGPLLRLMRAARLLEGENDYLGELHVGMAADLQAVDAALYANTHYPEEEVDMARRALLAAYDAVAGLEETRAAVARRIEMRRIEVQRRCGERLKEIAVIPDDDKRHDLLLSAFLMGGYLVEDHFERFTDAEINRGLLEGICTQPPWDEAFDSPQALARALHRRKWMTDDQLEELLEGWGQRWRA